MNKFSHYDHATKSYISKLVEVRAGERDLVDLIPASAAVQDALSDIRDLNKADVEYVDSAAAVIKCLSDQIKGRAVDEAEKESLFQVYSVARRRVIVEEPVGRHGVAHLPPSTAHSELVAA